MPRKKTVQPPPLDDSFELEDGTVVEIRDNTCRIIGRGLHKQDDFLERRDDILESVFNDYFVPDRSDPERKRLVFKRPTQNDYMRKASAFAREMECRGFGNGTDDSALRKTMYPDIKHNLMIFKNAHERYVLRPIS